MKGLWDRGFSFGHRQRAPARRGFKNVVLGDYEVAADGETVYHRQGRTLRKLPPTHPDYDDVLARYWKHVNAVNEAAQD